MIRKLLPILALATVLVSACGAPPDPVDDTRAALNGHSSQDWTTTQPWLCYVGNPMTAPYFPAGSYCTWQPDPNSDLLPYGVHKCVGAAPGVGKMWLYSGGGFAGSCAEIYSPHGTAPYQFDSDLVQANGWLETYEGIYGALSMRVGPTTNLILCAGPLTGPPGAPCNQYHSVGIGTFAQGVNYPSIVDPIGGGPFTVAAIQIWTAQ